MLKQAIDAYNFLLDIADLIKKPSLKIKSLVFAVLALAATFSTLWSVQTFSGTSADQLTKLTDGSQALPLQQQTGGNEKQATTTNSTTDNKSNDKADAADVAERKKAAANDKAGGSGESAASKSFRLPITKNSQYTAGMVIAHDAVKDDKVIYAGDLAFSADTVTISKANASNYALTVTTADGDAIGLPSKSAEDNLPNVAVHPDPVQTDPTTAYDMIIEVNEQTTIGSYQLHLVAARTASAPEAWQYHGFITVNITE